MNMLKMSLSKCGAICKSLANAHWKVCFWLIDLWRSVWEGKSWYENDVYSIWLKMNYLDFLISWECLDKCTSGFVYGFWMQFTYLCFCCWVAQLSVQFTIVFFFFFLHNVIRRLTGSYFACIPVECVLFFIS